VREFVPEAIAVGIDFGRMEMVPANFTRGGENGGIVT